MTSSYDYDLIVVGAGIAGMVSAVTACGLGKRVAVVEKHKLGGNCTNTTCIPSKALIRLGHAGNQLSRLSKQGLLVDRAQEFQKRNIMPHINRIVERAYAKDLPETFEAMGIRIFSGVASFLDPHCIAVGGQTISAAKFILATGTSPLVLEIPGLGSVDYLTNESLYDLTELPRSLIILGGGVDGLEYASAFGRLGVETTVVEASPRLIPAADAELVRILTAVLKEDGIRIMTGTHASSVSTRSGNIVVCCRRADAKTLDIGAQKLLVAVGRRPDMEALSLEKAGVHFTARGIVTDRKLRTSAPHIYACGDIAGPFQLATTAETQAIVAATNAFIPLKRAVNYRNNIFVVFTEPPLAWVGLTEADARKRYGRKLRVYRFPYTGMRRAMIDGTETGMAKILCDSRGRIVGAHILGESAGEVIHELQLLRAFHQPLHRLQNITHAYPTYAQAIAGRAGQLAFLDRMTNSIFVNLALRLMPGFANRLQLARDRLAETHLVDAFADLADSAVTKTAASTNVREFSIELKRAADETVILDIRGTLAESGREALAKTFGEATQTAKRVLINLSGLLGLDIHGVGVLVVEVTKARRRQIDIMACGFSGELRDVLRISGLDEIITLYEDEKDALCCRRFLEKSGLHAVSATNESKVSLPGWAISLDRLTLAAMPPSAMNINVEGRRLAGPVQGFGRLWEKRYRLHLAQAELAPREIVAIWRAEFPDFWPEGNFLFPSANAPIAPGTTALLNLSMPGGLVLATGLMVVHADDTSFSFMTAQGHILSGWITFSCAKLGDSTYIEVHPLFRSADPLMEMGFRLGAARQEDRFWHESLTRFALRLGTHGDVAQRDVLHDDRVQWKRMANLRFSAALSSSAYMPVYLLKKWFGSKKRRQEKAP